MDKNYADEVNSVSLAYLGDAVIELYIRENLIKKHNESAGNLHKMALSYVSASAQSKALSEILPLLSEEEEAVYKRGRNAKKTVPKSSDSSDYHRSTGLESLMGYLYLSGRNDRIKELLSAGFHIL